MDLQKLRPTHSQWRGPLPTAAEGRVRATQKPPAASATKTLAQPPKGRGNELWQKFHADAVARGHPEPERLADTLLRSRERALELEAARHKTILVTVAPKPHEAAASAPAKKGRPVVAEAQRCKARTLAGKQCGFKATCCGFCKKHAVGAAPEVGSKWFKVCDRSALKGISLKGFLNYGPKEVQRVFGEPNGANDSHVAMEWIIRFDDDSLVALFYRRDDPALHVCGASVAALAKVRAALG